MKKALTAIELIIVVVIIGIIASIATSAFKDDNLQLAKIELKEAIRYTQHMALSEHKFDPKDTEYKQKTGAINGNGLYFLELWQISFNGTSFSVWSDRNRSGTMQTGEAAKNPIDQNDYTINLGEKYNIKTIALKDGCAGANKILFDSKGRPLSDYGITSGYENIITTACKIEIEHADGNETITIQPETGYTE